MSQHRTLVYCDDTALPWWGWWCRDCPEERAPWTRSKLTAERSAHRHTEEHACTPTTPSQGPITAGART